MNLKKKQNVYKAQHTEYGYTTKFLFIEGFYQLKIQMPKQIKDFLID